MTTPIVSDAPIPDDLLASALLGAANRGGLGIPDESPAPETETPPPAAPESEPADDVPEEPESTESLETPEDEEETETPDTEPVDPFVELTKAGQPLAYTVDGQKKQYDGILEVPGKGAVIPPEHLGRVRDTIQRAEHAVEQNRQLYATQQEFQKVGGFEKMEELTRNVQRVDAMGGVLLEVFKDANEILALLERDANGNVALNDRAVKHLMERMEIAGTKADFAAREQFQTQRSSFREASSDGELMTAAIQQAVEMLGADLSADQRAFALEHFGQFKDALFRKATRDDVMAHPDGGFREGQKILDVQKMAPWFAKQAEQRTTTQTQVTTEVAKRTEAVKHNARVQSAAKPKVAPKAKPVPRNEDGTFKEQPKKKYDRDDFLRAAMRNEPTPGTTPDDE